MDKLFLALLKGLAEAGDILQANMYSGGNFSSITFKWDKDTYNFTISKEEKTDGNS